MRIMGQKVHALSRIGDADGARAWQRRQGAVVIAAAISQPVTMRIKRQQRDQKNIRSHARPMFQRFVNAIRAGMQDFAIGHQVELQRPILCGHARKGDMGACPRQSLEQQSGIGFILVGMIAGDDRAGRDGQRIGLGNQGSCKPISPLKLLLLMLIQLIKPVR